MTYQQYQFKKLSPEAWKAQQETRTQAIINKFKSYSTKELLEKIAHVYVTKNGSPCESWSLLNRVITEMNETQDARTFKAWVALGRSIKPKSKAFYIRKPVSKMVKVYAKSDVEHKGHYTIKYLKMNEALSENMEQISVLFGLQAEFRVEDTEGNDIKYENEPKELPPLMDIGKKLGLKVSWAKFTGRENGYYQSGTKKVVLKVYDWTTWFHELTHAIHEHIQGYLKGGQDKDQEIIAQMSACIIGSLYGIDISKYTYQYVMSYSQLNATEALRNIDKNMSMIQKILDFVFECETKKGTK